VSGAKELHVQLMDLPELSPGHPGASYILARLHVGVMKLDRVTRFLARHPLGGDALRSASWDQAQALLEHAAREEPCVPEHHVELARLYARRGDKAAAKLALVRVWELTEGKEAGRDAHVREHAERLAREYGLR
jgi:hypothetical protein